MELSQQSVHDVIHPTAAFTEFDARNGVESEGAIGAVPWSESRLNPATRINSLELPKEPLWRIDGCTSFGSQFYVTPLFVDSIPPYRVDVFIPEPSKLDAELREILDVDVVFHTRDADRILQLGLTRHLLQMLNHWASGMDDPKSIYKKIPFGSRIVLANFPKDVTEACITVAPTHALERQLMSVSMLEELWGSDVALPPAIDIMDAKYIAQLHDSVCLVEIQEKTYIFKALTSYSKYLYHELRQLLVIPPHPNIVARPVHLVTKKGTFGSKTSVLGFTLEFHVHGSMRDLIPFLKIHGRLSLQDQVKWSLQLASALLHLRETTGSFYPDLRLDNLVLSANNDLIMVDFEQRGVWCEFAAPEVNAIDYIRHLAVDEEIPARIREEYAGYLHDMLPGWEKMADGEDYSWPTLGYNIPWSCLTKTEQEACEVYMLGRVMWCIFEARSAPQRAAVWLSYRWEPLVEFPGYTSTPQPIRDLIDRCTRGTTPGLTRLIVREGNQLVLRKYENTGRSTAREVQETAREWWKQEIKQSMKWLSERKEGMENGTWKENYYDRPSLRKVRDALEKYRDENHLH